MSKHTNNGTIVEFIRCCWPLLRKARKLGATVRDLYKIAQEAGAPASTFSTFSTTYYKVAKARQIVSESDNVFLPA